MFCNVTYVYIFYLSLDYVFVRHIYDLAVKYKLNYSKLK
jgi:hypothetical protein